MLKESYVVKVNSDKQRELLIKLAMLQGYHFGDAWSYDEYVNNFTPSKSNYLMFSSDGRSICGYNENPNNGIFELKKTEASYDDMFKLLYDSYCEYIDNKAVDDLAKMMKEKLAKKRSEGYGGWKDNCSQEVLSKLLREHVEKGDVVDVANFCAFLFTRKESIIR